MPQQVVYTDRAERSKQKLAPAQKVKLRSLINAIQTGNYNSFKIIRIPNIRNTYIARLSKDDRVIFSISDPEIVIIDITDHEYLSKFRPIQKVNQ